MAEVTDRKGDLQAFGRGKASLGKVQACVPTAAMWANLGHRKGQESVGEHVTVQIASTANCTPSAVMPQRWVVERSFTWLEKHRRLWKNAERKLAISLQFIHLAFLTLLLRRC
jgi:transposase